MMQDEHLGGPARRNVFSQAIGRISQIYQRYLDLWTPHVVSRWIFASLLIFVFILRIFLAQGWYIVTYALGIYHLNLFIAFLTPKIDPAMDFDDDGPELPTRSNEEFRPFIRRLPEFKFWYSVMKSTVIAMICTMFDCFDIPVFWPILIPALHSWKTKVPEPRGYFEVNTFKVNRCEESTCGNLRGVLSTFKKEIHPNTRTEIDFPGANALLQREKENKREINSEVGVLECKRGNCMNECMNVVGMRER